MRSRLATLSLTALALLAASAPTASASGDFVGVYSEDAFYRSDAYRADAFARQAAAGVGLERIPFLWREIETAPGVYDFARYDAFVGAAARARLAVLPVLGDAPSFLSTAPAGTPSGTWYPPRDPSELARFAVLLVARYGPSGEFWQDHPEIDPVPITAWQVWNEPNLPIFWGGTPDPAGYADLLRTTGAAIHAADRQATVVSAGMPESTRGVPLGEFVDELYTAGVKGSFDVFGLHGYAPGLYGTVDMVAYARELLRSHGDSSPIWLTEFGWATGGASEWFTVSEAEQAERLRYTLAALWSRRAELGLRGIVYFKWRDSDPVALDAWPLHAGLLRSDGSAKPALAALADGVAAMSSPGDGADGSEATGVPGANVDATPPAGGNTVAPARARSRLFAVRWVEVAARRARLHVTCMVATSACRGRISVAAGKTRGAREFRVGSGVRAVLGLTLSRRVHRGRRWLRVRVSGPAAGGHARRWRLLVRRLPRHN